MKTKYFLILSILVLFYSICFSQDYWESIYSSEESIFCMTVDSNNNIFLGTLEGVLRSMNGGLDWELVLSVYQTKGIATNNQDYIFASPYPLYLSTDNGDSWNELNMTSSADIVTIFEDSQNNIFAGFWGGIFKSSNYGNDWELVLSVETMEVVNQIVENSEGVLFAGSINYIGVGTGGVYQSFDHGDSWEVIGLEYEFISSLAINSNGEIFAGSRGHYYEYGGGVFRSSDNGETWIELRDDVLVTSIAIDSGDKIYIGCSDVDYFNGAVRYSEDNGETWQMIESELITPDIGIEFLAISNDNYLYAISYENVNHVYRSVEPTTTGVINFSIPEVVDVKLSNYPNPFKPSGAGRSPGTTISYDLPVNIVNPIIEIFNIKGEKVKSLCAFPSGNCPMGTRSVVWDGTDKYCNQVASGVYLYRLKSDEDVLMSKKMLLLR